MFQTINNSDFHDAFIRMGRKENFSYEGRNALFEYLEDYEPEMELDVVALCCSYSEYSSATACAEEYGMEGDYDDDGEDEDEDAQEEAKETYFMEALQDKTIVITFSGGIIIENF